MKQEKVLIDIDEVSKGYSDTILIMCRKVDKLSDEIKDVHNEIVDLRKEIKEDFKDNHNTHNVIKSTCARRLPDCMTMIDDKVSSSVKGKIDAKAFYTVVSILCLVFGGAILTLFKLYGS